MAAIKAVDFFIIIIISLLKSADDTNVYYNKFPITKSKLGLKVR
ncbi:hypothetical protein PTUN_a2791 [Pseudoalteromonas tunicata]|uniref:Uncharacterized protein n=1 Tax=Pseudoalteromonas tunicata D2 TaxID=87626 RepID=A4C5I7_9GAMM|nr:hypothetical protein PTUN_a2791 [Pseudoalteromonas tunicata]EAR29241.1 hypothetical protein PTD2_10514 [Pseudoalteromonas tunicata D2]